MPSFPLQKGYSLKYTSPESPFSSFQTPFYNEKESSPSSSVSRISPLILLVIIVLAVIFFVYGIVHLVLWFLMKTPSSSSPLYNSNRFPESTRSRALQRQLHHLFRLHDSGLEQSLIDSLPVFFYEDVLGLKEPFDCAVCLCELSDRDKLRLLPMCSHAFHINCIDTWLLSNSTCPLCRATISSSSGLSMENPLFENSWVLNRFTGDEENVNGRSDGEDQISEKRVFSVRLGKFRNVNGVNDGGGDEDSNSSSSSSSSCNLDARRCFSMGSYQYVVSGSNLRVVLCGGERNEDGDGKRIGERSKGESFSVSKIWLWSNKSKFHESCNGDFPRVL